MFVSVMEAARHQGVSQGLSLVTHTPAHPSVVVMLMLLFHSSRTVQFRPPPLNEALSIYEWWYWSMMPLVAVVVVT